MKSHSSLIDTAVELVRKKRTWVDIWRVALDASMASRAGGQVGVSTDDYIVALETAVAQGLIERNGSKVRVKPMPKKKKPITKPLF